MKRFAARAFYQVGRLLATVKCSCAHAKPKGDLMFAKPLEQRIDDPKILADFVGQIAELCQSIGLGLSLVAAQRLAAKVASMPLTNRQIIVEIDALDERIRDEMANQLFFFMPLARSDYYLQPPEPNPPMGMVSPLPLWNQKEKLFGAGVQDAFPSCVYDFEEAGMCLAFGRGTACVMHLSKVVEAGLKVLAVSQLKLPARNNWGQHLNDIEKELTNRYKTSGVRAPDELFYSEAAAQIGHIKNAWRNPTMHVERKLTVDEAEEVFVAVRSFMRYLATRVHE